MTNANPTRSRIIDGLGVLALTVVTTTASLRQEDVRFWDESMYLERGLSLSFGAQPGWEWNPLYADMYWLLGRVFTDPINLYFAGRATTAIAIVLAVWLSLRLFTGSGIAIAGGLLTSALPIAYVWPGVSSPSAAFLLLAIAVAWRWRSPPAFVGAAALTWLAAATRPEFVWAALAVTVIVAITLVVSTVRGKLAPAVILALSAALIATPAILTVAYGNPLDLGSRSWEAFEQHYELRFATSTDDPWQIDADIIGRDFPAASSIPGALLVNTPAFATHVAKNALTLPVSAGGHFMGLGGDSPIQNMIGVITAVLWVVALFVCVLRAPRDALVLLSRSGRAITARSSVVASSSRSRSQVPPWCPPSSSIPDPTTWYSSSQDRSSSRATSSISWEMRH